MASPRRMTRPAPKRLTLLFMLLFFSTSMYFYWSRVPQYIDAIAPSPATRPRPLTDLYPRWYGTRELLLHHRDPYGAAVTREIQLAYDGREERFAYPLYVVFLVAPTVGMQFHSAQIVFWWFLATATTLSLALWLSVALVRWSLSARVALFAAVLLSIPVLQGLRLLQFGLLVAALLAGTAAAAVSGHLFLAGVLLALATIKPPLSILAACWFMLWVSGDWPHRRSLLWGFAGTLTVLVLASECLVPGWLFRYPGVLAAYAKYTDAGPLIGMFMPDFVRWPVAVGGSLATAMFCWAARRKPARSVHFIFALSFVLTLTVMVIPTALPPYNHVLLVPAVLLVVHGCADLWSRGSLSRFLVVLFICIATLPWLLALIVNLGSLTSLRPWSLHVVLAPLYASLELPFAVLGLLILLAKTRLSVLPIDDTPRGPSSASTISQATE
jgi:hypothetical protein